MRYPLLLFVLLQSYALLAQNSKDTISLYFDLNRTALNSNARSKLDSAIYNEDIYRGQHIMIIGYADYLGSEKYNENLSAGRAKNVQQYLQQYGITKENITLCIGKGEIERQGINSGNGYAADRKVDIVVKRHSQTSKLLSRQPAPQKAQPGRPAEQATKHTGNLEDITSYKPGETLVLRNIYFPAESHDISNSFQTLNKLYNILVAHPALKISIEGHVCCINGYPDAYDIDTKDNNLSLNRAKAIYDYLVDKGIDPDRLKYYGFGKSRPIVAVERNEDDAEKNRRVEIRILAK